MSLTSRLTRVAVGLALGACRPQSVETHPTSPGPAVPSAGAGNGTDDRVTRWLDAAAVAPRNGLNPPEGYWTAATTSLAAPCRQWWVEAGRSETQAECAWWNRQLAGARTVCD